MNNGINSVGAAERIMNKNIKGETKRKNAIISTHNLVKPKCVMGADERKKAIDKAQAEIAAENKNAAVEKPVEKPVERPDKKDDGEK